MIGIFVQVVQASCLIPDIAPAEAPLDRVEAVLPVDGLLYSLTFTQIAPTGETQHCTRGGSSGPC
jgi:hypothetical protein